ncbi:MAG TPA: MFS transporter [Terriglobia bacterium]|nr:MFS transporter [Terriglobia bacterium]
MKRHLLQENPVRHRRWLRIIPVALVMYTISYIDRTNISLALPSMSRGLHMNAVQAGSAAGIFFWGYLLFQIPGGHLASRGSPKRLVSILLILWGACAVGTGLVQTWRELWLMRLLLGAAESGVFPATLILLANWFPRSERARANAYWMLCQPVALILSSPLSGYILGRWNWRVLLVSEGVLPFLWLVIWEVFIDDRPAKAAWISRQERESLEATLRRERLQTVNEPHVSFRKTLLQPQVLLMIGVYFLLNCGSYGYLFWLPSALASVRKLPSFSIGVLFSIPYVLAGFAMVFNSRHSDKSRERRLHVAVPLILSGVLLFGAVFESRHSTLLSFALISLAAAGPFATLGPFWAIPTETLPKEVAGAAMGMINALGSFGGFFGPFAVGIVKQRTHNFVDAFFLLSTALAASGIIAVFLRKEKRAAWDLPAAPLEETTSG